MANDRDCENCIHKVNRACNVWECKFEPKRGMTKEEAIEIIECGEISNRWGKDGEEVEKMAIEALRQKPSISEDGTLTVNVEDGSKVSRVLVCGDNHFGGLYYPEQEPKSEWQQDHEILKAYSDGANAVLDKIRDEIEQLPTAICTETFRKNLSAKDFKEDVFKIIDNYKAEGSEE